MTETLLPVWYLQTGRVDPAGNFSLLGQASAVLVAVLKKGENGARKLLLTVQHALRTDLRAGQYHNHFFAWPPGVGYNPKQAFSVSIFDKLTPDEASPFAEPEDLAFLELPPDASGSAPAILLEDALCQVNLDELNIAGYISGENLISNNASIVVAAMHPGWRFVGKVSPTAVGILGPGDGQPGPGVSGGGVFHKGRLAGLYRGAFPGTGEHVFLPITRLREWCDMRGFELVNPTSTRSDAGAAARLLQDKYSSRVVDLPWPDLLRLITSLGFEAAKFSENSTKEELAETFWMAVRENSTPIDLVAEKFVDVVVTSVSLLGPGTGLPAAAKPMVSLVREKLGTIRAAKAVHDLVQHQFAFKIDAYASAVNRLCESTRVVFETRKTIRAMREDIVNVLGQVPELSPAARSWLQNETVTVRQVLEEAAASVKEIAASPNACGNVDLITGFEMTLKPFAAQVPSKMQEILTIEVSNLPLDPLAAASGHDAFRSLGSLQGVLLELVTDQGVWQSLHNELSRLSERLDPLFEGSNKVAREVVYLARNLVNLAKKTPEATTCELFAIPFYSEIMKLPVKQPPDKEAIRLHETKIRFHFEEFAGFVSDMFKRADEKLLRTCDQLQELSDSLDVLAKSFGQK